MRADRLLSILLLLQSHRRMTARQLAERLEVSERTILRDMDCLSASGVPVIAERGNGGGWSLLEGYETRLTGLKPSEIQTLFLGRPVRLMADLGLKEDADAALAKLAASLPTASRARAEFASRRILIDPRGWRDPGETVECLPVLLDAVWRGRRLRFIYAGVLSAEPAERTVDPLGLVAKGATWYLIGRAAGEARTYRVSRMRNASVLDESAETENSFDLREYWERSISEFREKLPRYEAEFLIHSEAIRWVRYRGWRLIEERVEGERVRVRVRFDAEEEAVQFALSLGAALVMLDPPMLRERVREQARAILKLAGESATVAQIDRFPGF
jgi:predicted DNA-binding transcriptional regulator YafY